MHGAGAYYGCTHTNSKEAFEYWYKKGIKVFEIDVGIDENYNEGIAFAHRLKRDGDWLHKEVNPRHVKADYKTTAIYPESTRGLSIMSISEVFSYLRDDSEMLIMFDLWEGWDYELCCKLTRLISHEIGNHLELWDRLLIEVYTNDMILAVKNVAPAAHMIFGESAYGEAITMNQLISSGISFVSFPRKMARRFFSKFQEYKNHCFTVFSYSSSNLGWKKWKKKGVDVSIIDNKYDNIFQIVRYLYLSILHGIHVLRVSVDYYGFRQTIKIIIKKTFRIPNGR